jgi:hypothetical protein
MLAEAAGRVRLSGLRLEFETYNTGGNRVSTPDEPAPQPAGFPAFRGFDQKQSFYADFEAKPSENVTAMLSLNILGTVPTNPIDEIFYENRGRPKTVVEASGGELGPLELKDIERVKVYRGSVSWDDRWFQLEGFYRTGHYHWGYEGDFFGLYREANYGENIDIYNGEAPVGLELSGKKWMEGLKLAYGPQLWWGANPAVLVKYTRRVGPFDATGVFQEDIAEQSSVISTIALPLPTTRKATLHLAAERGDFGIEVGGIWSGSTKIDDEFQIVEPAGGSYDVLRDSVRVSDTFGGKAKVTYEKGRWHWYAQGAIMGLVADGGPTGTTTFTGWHLKDSGSGNQSNFLTGLAYNIGDFQIAPNFLWQKPIAGPVPADAPAPATPRNVPVLEDPFEVRANREMVAAEILVTYDPTPATWMYMWDNDVKEDARFAANLGFVYRDLRTTQDAGSFIAEDGVTRFAFPAATPPRSLWEVHGRFVSSLSPDTRIVGALFLGQGEPNGDDPRRIDRFGCAARVVWGPAALMAAVKFNDWGPYDYHRDFNLTFPTQLMGDLSYALGAPEWFGFPHTRFGVRGTWRALDGYSPRYCPAIVPGPSGPECDPTVPALNGSEWEVRTYLHFAL